MSNEDIRQFYDNDPDFKKYVDECRKMDGRSAEEELKLKIVRNVAGFYHARSKGAGAPDHPQQEA